MSAKNMISVSCLAALLLSACHAGSAFNMRMLEGGGDIRTDIADDDSYDYKVFIKSTFHLNWDGAKEADRLRAVNTMFKDSCKQVEVIDQIPIKKGEYWTGREATTWVMKVKCVN